MALGEDFYEGMQKFEVLKARGIPLPAIPAEESTGEIFQKMMGALVKTLGGLSSKALFSNL
jgi:hypothetical protein